MHFFANVKGKMWLKNTSQGQPSFYRDFAGENCRQKRSELKMAYM
jgi:hypothetical protein